LALLRRTGLLGLGVPGEHGGAGAGAVQLNRSVEQVATVNPSASIMLFQHYAVTARIAEWGTARQRGDLLPRLGSGQWLAASAWSETGAGADKKRLSTTGVLLDGGGWLLNGAKSFTTSAGIADVYLVLTETADAAAAIAADQADGAAGARPDTGYGSDSQTFFLVSGQNPGLVPDTGLSLAGMRGSATGFVSLRDCRVPADSRLGPVGATSSIIAGVRESGATLGAVAVGIAQAALDLAFAQARQRGLLGGQALRHRLVEWATEVEAARSIVERAGRRDAADAGVTTLYSKLFASTAAERVCAEVQQMLGSAGYVDTHPVNRCGRDARAVALMGPTNELCRELVSRAWQS
jgi:alkylation response protein AidB-like acyl-CoA dehydrogenase